MTEIPWEDNLLERKLESDLRDLSKTLVAFSNSVRPGHIAVILIGEANNGEVQGVTNPDNIQKKLREYCDKIYPSILWKSTVYETDNKYCIRVEIEYDGETPHFGDAAWIRKGSETIKATDEIFQRLIDFRLSEVRELAKWKDRNITMIGHNGISYDVHLVDLTAFWVTIEYLDGGYGGERKSIPLGQIVLSWDDKKEHLKVLLSRPIW